MKRLNEYQTEVVNAQIPYAVRYANEYVEKLGGNPDDLKWRATWCRVYHEQMDTLCKKAGVRV